MIYSIMIMNLIMIRAIKIKIIIKTIIKIRIAMK